MSLTKDQAKIKGEVFNELVAKYELKKALSGGYEGRLKPDIVLPNFRPPTDKYFDLVKPAAPARGRSAAVGTSTSPAREGTQPLYTVELLPNDLKTEKELVHFIQGGGDVYLSIWIVPEVPGAEREDSDSWMVTQIKS